MEIRIDMWKELERISIKEEKERLLEDIQESEAKEIFDKYASKYDDALKRLSF